MFERLQSRIFFHLFLYLAQLVLMINEIMADDPRYDDLSSSLDEIEETGNKV